MTDDLRLAPPGAKPAAAIVARRAAQIVEYRDTLRAQGEKFSIASLPLFATHAEDSEILDFIWLVQGLEKPW